ncbi:hypothetical protein B0H15DRAFT_803586 [Mycena belliarum]|uniref:Uncharacterized protein n=1 Tax=Mycena belliarum TaxID=1033014 RepID=A0AAD6TY48_9AGAR|nr:hypothetical protein B0H15DRAFT_803586 [Mycena belliae]
MAAVPVPPSSSPSIHSEASAKAPSRALPIAIALVASVLLLVAIMLLSFYLRRRTKQKASAAPARKGREVQPGETVSRPHPAALMITPAEGKGTPRFVHTPGTNMRIASRRPDGAWEFADPRAPFAPAIIADDARPLSRNSSATSTFELLPPSRAASPWGAPTTPGGADSVRSWRTGHSPTPSASSTPIVPVRSISGSRHGSIVSTNAPSLQDPERAEVASTYSNPFLSPSPSVASLSSARWPAPSPPSSARASPDLRPPVESRAARAIRLGYEELDRSSTYSEQQGTQRAGTSGSSLQPPMTPAAHAKEMESRAARKIRQGYENVDRNSEYTEQDEALPAY